MANKYDTCTFLDKEGTGVFVAIIMRSVTYYIFFFNISISQKRKLLRWQFKSTYLAKI